MSRLGLQARDSLSLSFTKLKIRRIRTALTLITTSILALILVVGSSVMTGFMNAANSTPQSELVGLHLAKVYKDYIAYSPFSDSSTSMVIPEKPTTVPPLDLAKDEADVTKKVKDQATLRDVYFEVKSSSDSMSTTLDIIEGSAPKPGDPNYESGFYGGSPSLTARSEELLKPFVDDSQNLSWKDGEPLPVLVPTDALINAHKAEFDKIKNAKQRVAKRDQYQAAALGKVGKLTVEERSFATFSSSTPMEGPPPEDEVKTTNLNVKVVGFLPAANILSSDDGNFNYVVPFESTSKNADVAKILNTSGDRYLSFSTTKARNTFVSANEDASIYADTIESNKEYFGPLKKAFGIGVVVMLILMAIPMAATISKLLSDSQRETGVFRAIGARNRNIVAIYGLYSLQLVVASFLLALAAGELICLWLTNRYAEEVELAAADYAGAVVNVSFAQFNLTQMSVIFGGLLAGAILGIAIPMLRALRRDPIKSLRDE